MRTPDTAHLCPEDAALVEELYLQRWADLSPGEAVRARAAAITARDQHPSRHAQHAA